MPRPTSNGLLSLQPIEHGCLHSNATACFSQGGLATGERLRLLFSILSSSVAFCRGSGVAFVRLSATAQGSVVPFAPRVSCLKGHSTERSCEQASILDTHPGPEDRTGCVIHPAEPTDDGAGVRSTSHQCRPGKTAAVTARRQLHPSAEEQEARRNAAA